ncbi:annexin A13-like [Parasteatoda tepidariorum]|uniref:annexin A13-like n=1 Tax=Parasteatoda tepidariorum TaxID=114398 RepID=UPI001C720788|nr:annexin A13-like [Parasteatoda tepidariorum]
MATVIFHHPFDSESDAVALKDAISSLGERDDALIQILGNRTNEQRKRIMETYKIMFDQDLRDTLLYKLTGNFKRTVELLLMPLAEYYAKLLRRAIYGPGKDEDLLLEILCTITNIQIQQIKEIYQCKFGKSLEDSIANDCQSKFKHMLLLICKAERNEGVVSLDKVRNDAEALFEAGEAEWETDEAAFNTLFAFESYEHLRFVFQEYEDITGRTLSEAIEAETTGYMKKALLTIVRCVENTPAYFARKLYRALKGPTKDDKSLIRIVVSRCEIDMVFIKTEYQKRFKEHLEDTIRGNEPENYEKLLMALVTLDKQKK